jgi:hypothetical protein
MHRKILIKRLITHLFFFLSGLYSSDVLGQKLEPGWELEIRADENNFRKYSGNGQNLKSLNKMMEKDMELWNSYQTIVMKMTFNNTNILLTDTISPKKLKSFYKKHSAPITNCESFNFAFPEWYSPFYFNPGPVKSEIVINDSVPEGKGCLLLEGTDHNEDGYICSFTKHYKHLMSDYTGIVPAPRTDADQTWISFYAFGYGDTNSVVSVMVCEESPESGGHDEDRVGFYSATVPLDFYGWRQIAIKYSELEKTVPWYINNPGQRFGKLGDTKKDPGHLLNIQFGLSTKRKGAKATVLLDNINLLFNK